MFIKYFAILLVFAQAIAAHHMAYNAAYPLVASAPVAVVPPVQRFIYATPYRYAYPQSFATSYAAPVAVPVAAPLPATHVTFGAPITTHTQTYATGSSARAVGFLPRRFVYASPNRLCH